MPDSFARGAEYTHAPIAELPIELQEVRAASAFSERKR